MSVPKDICCLEAVLGVSESKDLECENFFPPASRAGLTESRHERDLEIWIVETFKYTADESHPFPSMGIEPLNDPWKPASVE
jgi:hypothetical protein